MCVVNSAICEEQNCKNIDLSRNVQKPRDTLVTIFGKSVAIQFVVFSFYHWPIYSRNIIALTENQ